MPPPSILGFEFRSEFSYYYLALVFLGFVMYLLSRIMKSRFGRSVRSLRAHEPLSSSVGIAPTRTYVVGFAFACALVGFSGAMYAHYYRFVNPNLLGFRPMMAFLIIVLVGGSGTLWGPVLGAVAFVWVSELLRLGEELRFFIFGLILLGIVVFMPQGAYPALRSGWSWLRTLRGRVMSRYTSDIEDTIASEQSGEAHD